jgi:hypothetical protein
VRVNPSPSWPELPPKIHKSVGHWFSPGSQAVPVVGEKPPHTSRPQRTKTARVAPALVWLWALCSLLPPLSRWILLRPSWDASCRLGGRALPAAVPTAAVPVARVCVLVGSEGTERRTTRRCRPVHASCGKYEVADRMDVPLGIGCYSILPAGTSEYTNVSCSPLLTSQIVTHTSKT